MANSRTHSRLLPFLSLMSALLVAFAICFAPSVKVLCIQKLHDASFRLYSRDALKGFVISYTHSVNKGRIHDYYACTEDLSLLMQKTVFSSYGAGIMEPQESIGSTFTVGQGDYEIANIDRKLKSLLMSVGLVADHCIKVGAKEVYLKDIFGVQTSIVLSVKRIGLLDYLLTRGKIGGLLDVN